MKKLTITIALVIGLGMSSFADGNQGGGLFQRGSETEENSSYDRGSILTPGIPGHGGNQNQNAPLGTGIALLTALGAAYLVGKKRKAE